MRRPGTLPPGRREYSIGPVTDLREPKVGSRDRALFDFQRPHEAGGSLCWAPGARPPSNDDPTETDVTGGDLGQYEADRAPSRPSFRKP